MMYHLHPPFPHERNELKSALHDETNGSQVVFTTRLQQLDDYGARHSKDVMMMDFLKKMHMNLYILVQRSVWMSLIHGVFGGIKLIDCNPSGAEQMKKATQDWKVEVHSSWDDKK
ncbi:hypothetical protein SASPL_157144 [Salvia splendens]|uniref:Uncharacterized protein n=1 Tax=Salvia splendens TaxID=180675 RepID=A0A8X8VVF5_SALSN|nr:hypothetical protein SASPL_157144 [Salvia splendens]